MSEAVEFLGVTRRTIYRKCDEYAETGGDRGLRHKRMGPRRLIRIPESAVLGELSEPTARGNGGKR